MEQRYRVKCAVPECQTVLCEGDLHYALGGLGRVSTCVQCATKRTLSFKVGRNEVTEPRGWDNVPVWVHEKICRPLERPCLQCNCLPCTCPKAKK